MILRVDVDSIAAMIELDGEPWTPELLQTLLRILGDEVIRSSIALAEGPAEGDEEDGSGTRE